MTTPATIATGYTEAYAGTNGGYTDLTEQTAEFLWPQRNRVIDQMRRDYQIRSTLSAITLPLRRAEWRLDPRDSRPGVYQALAEDLGVLVLGKEKVPLPPTRGRRYHANYHEHVRLATLSLIYGHMGFEPLYTVDPSASGPKARLDLLAERMPSTISRFVIDPQGRLEGVVQQPSGDPESYRRVNPQYGGLLIPRKNLMWYTNEREGGGWFGTSLLRSAYGPWMLKQRLMRVGAVALERNGMGIPEVTPPAGATPAQIAEAQRLASTIRVGANTGIGLPPGFTVKYRGVDGSVPDALPWVQHYDTAIAKSMLAQWIDLGQTASGNRALGESFIDFFTMANQAFADDIARTTTLDLVNTWVDYNYGSDEPAPAIVCGGIGVDEEATADAIDSLIKSGAIETDDDLESWVRAKYNLPTKGAPRLSNTQPRGNGAVGGPADPGVALAKPASPAPPSEPPVVQAASMTKDSEDVKIKQRRRSGEAFKPHRFQAAQFTFGNGHTRCGVCGGGVRLAGDPIHGISAKDVTGP